MTRSVLICVALLAIPPVDAADVQFNRDVRPILSDKCLHCHGADAAARKIRLRLDREDSAKADLGKGARAVLPGSSGESELIRRITSTQPALRMPPAYSGLKLSDAEISTLKSWIDGGAEWQRHWAFVPPAVADPPSGTHPVDWFVRARLAREGLKPSPETDRVTLLRRVTFDLTGLPPTPSEVDAFTSDTSANAYEKVVDRLLASTRFGERMAARWLDAARYADTNGYQTDAERVMWRWRDWVIDAFNRNKPFDQFAVEQIAGDLLPNATLDQKHKYDPFTQREFYGMLAYFNNVPELGRYLKYGNTPPYISAPTVEQQQTISRLEAAVATARNSFSSATRNLAAEQQAWEKALAPGLDWHVEEALEVALPVSATLGGEPAGRLAGDYGAYGFLDRFTIAALVLPQSTDGAIVSRSEEKDDGEGWSVVLDNGKLQVNLVKRKLDDSIRVETQSAIALNQWQHIAVSYDGSRLAAGVKVYIDGKLQALNVILDAINQDFRTGQPLRVGGRSNSRSGFRGQVEQVRMYRDVLTQEEAAIEASRKSLAEVASLPEPKRTEGERSKMRRAFLETGPNATIRQSWTVLRQAERKLEDFHRTVPTVMVMAESPTRKETFLLDRGSYDRPKDKVTRGVPAVLHGMPSNAPDNRLGLAKWIVDPMNPLTARVAVNRFWQMYFGTGVVKTTEDFGSQGEWPLHPELLDWLASNFVRTGWDVKGLQKTIVMSATYRQSSKVSPDLLARDPENRLLARGPRMRLPAEMLRDQALFASGLLVEKLGGPSVKPYQPAGIWSELGDKDYERDHGEGLYRRSLYTFWKRTAAPPFMGTFDSATRESCVVRESRTNTPLQALNLMNDVTFVEAARVLAQHAIASSPDMDARLTHAFRRILARSPRAGEMQKLRSSLAYYSDHYRSQPGEAAKLAGQGDAPQPAGVSASDIAAYTAVTSLLFNLDEAVTKE
jgi:hypothetical protein